MKKRTFAVGLFVALLSVGLAVPVFAEESVGEPIVAEESVEEPIVYESLASEGDASDTIVGAGSTVQGLNVEAHTQAEIQKFFNAHPWSVDDEVTYQSQPSYCEPYYQGKLSDYTVERALNAVNTIRYIAGLNANIVLDKEQEKLAQSGSFVNYLNNIMTHYPERPTVLSASKYDTLWEDGYTGCSSSNISCGRGTLNSAIINGWMSDADASNIDRVGHRRWILNPSATSTGFGANGGYYNYYAFSWDGESTATNIAWPAANMPVEYFGTNEPWSLSTGKTLDMDSVSVTLKRKSDSKVWKFNSSSADGYFNVNNGGYGMTGCVIFRPDNLSSLSAGDVFEVTVVLDSSITVKYTVNFFSLNTDAAFSNVDHWLKDNKSGKYWYRYSDGSYPKNKWAKIDGKWYLFDKSGWLLTGWQKRNGNWYYLGTDGAMQTDWIFPNGASYYMKPTGEMAVGWVKYDDTWLYFNSSGHIVTSTWVKTSGKWYYLDSEGHMAVGFTYIGDKQYYFNNSGEMVTGWKKIDGYWYYFKSSGEMANNSWIKLSGKWYYFDGQGRMSVGSTYIDDKYYYFNNGGDMHTGWKKIGKNWYYYKANGEEARNSWVKKSGKWYYFDMYGRMVVGYWVIDGKYYHFNENGVMISG